MRDGRTRKTVEKEPGRNSFSDFSRSYQATLVVLSGELQGSDYPIERSRTVLGRGPGVDIPLDDSTLSRQHASVEYADGGLRLCDLGSLNGVLLNGDAVEQAEVSHGDRFQLGDLVLQLVVESRERTPKIHYIADD